MLKAILPLFFIYLLANLLCSVAFSLPNSVISADCTRPVKIGVILPLTGDYKIAGTALTNGVSFAASRLPEKCTLKLIFEDDALQQAKTVTAFHKLTSIDKPDALIVFSSGSAKAVAPLIEEKGILTLAIASDLNVSKGRYLQSVGYTGCRSKTRNGGGITEEL